METSDSIKGIATALAKFQGEVEGVRKDKTNPAFKSPYSTLAEVIETIKEPMSKAGLAYVQLPGVLAEGRLEFTTLIMHGESGEWIKASTTIPLTKQDAQGYGSALSYVRRYSLMSILGLPSVDDDGEAAVVRHHNDREAPKQAPARSAKAAEDYVKLASKAIEASWSADDLRKWWKDESGSRRHAGLDGEQEDFLKGMCAGRIEVLKGPHREAAE